MTTPNETVKISPRTRNLLYSEIERIYLDAWDLKERLLGDNSDEIEVDVFLRRLNLIINQAKRVDRTVKNNRRRAARKASQA